jgi:hypothetical protein
LRRRIHLAEDVLELRKGFNVGMFVLGADTDLERESDVQSRPSSGIEKIVKFITNVIA